MSRRPRRGMFNLPSALRGRWRIVDRLEDVGAQATLFLVEARSRSRQPQRQAILKIYHGGRPPDPVVHGRLLEADCDHLVRVYMSQADEDGVWFELLEYVQGGTLEALIGREGPALRDARAREVLEEIATGISQLHTVVGASHRDIKPSNIMVDRLRPLRLKIADFGTVANLENGARSTVAERRTVAYAAPETGQRQVDYPADWWSLGIILVEVLTGRHPLSDPNGRLLDTDVILERLARDPVDTLVEGVPDAWRDLCRGLLRGRPLNRWNEIDVTAWLAGQPTRPIVEEPRGPFDYRPMVFGGREFWDPRAVARQLAADWMAARTRLERGEILNWVRDELRDTRLQQTLQEIDDAYRAIDVRLFLSIVALHPAIEPAFGGHLLTLGGMATLAASARGQVRAAQRDETEATPDPFSPAAVLQLIYDERVLHHYAQLAQVPAYATLDRDWRGQMAALNAAADVMPPEVRTLVSENVPFAAAAALGALAAPDAVMAELTAAAQPARNPDLADCGWFREVSAASETSAALLALMPQIAPFAEAPARQERQRRRANDRTSSLRGVKQIAAALLVGVPLVVLLKTGTTYVSEVQRRGGVVEHVAFRTPDGASVDCTPRDSAAPHLAIGAPLAMEISYAHAKVETLTVATDSATLARASAQACSVVLADQTGRITCPLGPVAPGLQRFRVTIEGQTVAHCVTAGVGALRAAPIAVHPVQAPSAKSPGGALTSPGNAVRQVR